MRKRSEAKSQVDDVVPRLRRRLMHYYPGSRLPGHKQLARLLNATERTIVLAVSQLAKEGVVELRERGGTVVLSAPQAMPIREVHVLNDHKPRLLFAETVLLGVSKRCAHHGLRMVADRDPPDLVDARALRQLAGGDPLLAGWVLLLAEAPPDSTLSDWQVRGIPFVVVDDFPQTAHVNTISRDVQRAVHEATCKLLDLGHRRIALVGIYLDSHPISQQRLRGFESAHSRLGLQVDPSMIVHGDPVHYEPARQELQRLLERADRPTALVGVDQSVGCGLLSACGRARLDVPREISVISAGLHPRLEPELLSRLSCFDEGPPERMGELAVDVLVNHHNQVGITNVFLGSCYVDRGSIAAPPDPSIHPDAFRHVD
ncbi:MAG: substrate-binding domain-containing protein [Phycisphaerae bacterium]|nr:substrate-binding domain-containing protein [Phycisphaerae bacterium]